MRFEGMDAASAFMDDLESEVLKELESERDSQNFLSSFWFMFGAVGIAVVFLGVAYWLYLISAPFWISIFFLMCFVGGIYANWEFGDVEDDSEKYECRSLDELNEKGYTPECYGMFLACRRFIMFADLCVGVQSVRYSFGKKFLYLTYREDYDIPEQVFVVDSLVYDKEFFYEFDGHEFKLHVPPNYNGGTVRC